MIQICKGMPMAEVGFKMFYILHSEEESVRQGCRTV